MDEQPFDVLTKNILNHSGKKKGPCDFDSYIKVPLPSCIHVIDRLRVFMLACDPVPCKSVVATCSSQSKYAESIRLMITKSLLDINMETYMYFVRSREMYDGLFESICHLYVDDLKPVLCCLLSDRRFNDRIDQLSLLQLVESRATVIDYDGFYKMCQQVASLPWYNPPKPLVKVKSEIGEIQNNSFSLALSQLPRIGPIILSVLVGQDIKGGAPVSKAFASHHVWDISPHMFVTIVEYLVASSFVNSMSRCNEIFDYLRAIYLGDARIQFSAAITAAKLFPLKINLTELVATPRTLANAFDLILWVCNLHDSNLLISFFNQPLPEVFGSLDLIIKFKRAIAHGDIVLSSAEHSRLFSTSENEDLSVSARRLLGVLASVTSPCNLELDAIMKFVSKLSSHDKADALVIGCLLRSYYDTKITTINFTDAMVCGQTSLRKIASNIFIDYQNQIVDMYKMVISHETDELLSIWSSLAYPLNQVLPILSDVPIDRTYPTQSSTTGSKIIQIPEFAEYIKEITLTMKTDDSSIETLTQYNSHLLKYVNEVCVADIFSFDRIKVDTVTLRFESVVKSINILARCLKRTVFNSSGKYEKYSDICSLCVQCFNTIFSSIESISFILYRIMNCNNKIQEHMTTISMRIINSINDIMNAIISFPKDQKLTLWYDGVVVPLSAYVNKWCRILCAIWKDCTALPVKLRISYTLERLLATLNRTVGTSCYLYPLGVALNSIESSVTNIQAHVKSVVRTAHLTEQHSLLTETATYLESSTNTIQKTLRKLRSTRKLTKRRHNHLSDAEKL